MGSFLSSPAKEEEWKSDARHAMESGWFCVICGGPFDTEGDVYNIDPKEERFQWLFDFRLLGSPSYVLDHKVTSEDAQPLNVSNSEDVFLSEKAWFSATGSGYFQVGGDAFGGDIWFDTLRPDFEGDTLIALHDACINISCRVIEHLRDEREDSEQSSSLAVLNQILQARFRDRANASHEMRNDLLDLCTTSDIYGPRSVMALSKLEWWRGEHEDFCTDPINVPNLTSVALDILCASPTKKITCTEVPQPTREPRGLERLPTELLDLVCNCLPATSVIALHRASKTLAMKTPLDTTFWRDGLLNGSLLPHIWDLNRQKLERSALESTRDWKGVARLLATKRVPATGRHPLLNEIPTGFWNRCRIWSIMEEAVKFQLPKPPFRSSCDSAIDVCKRPRPV